MLEAKIFDNHENNSNIKELIKKKKKTTTVKQKPDKNFELWFGKYNPYFYIDLHNFITAYLYKTVSICSCQRTSMAHLAGNIWYK